MLSLLVLCFGLVGVDDGDASIPKDSAERAAYEAAQAKAGHDAKAHVQLALWCEAHGLTSERIEQLVQAVLQDPHNAVARGLLGLALGIAKHEFDLTAEKTAGCVDTILLHHQ